MEQFWSMIGKLLLDQGSEFSGIRELIETAPERLPLGGVLLCAFKVCSLSIIYILKSARD
jgi:hypothetical protein